MKHFCEAGELAPLWVDDYCFGDWTASGRFQMEERNEPHPDHLLPDGTLYRGLAGD